jgi:hypothetical protein
MFRRDVVLAVGGYHAAFRHCEDLDLWLRLASVTKLCSLPDTLIHYRHYAGQVSSRHATEQQTGAAIARIAYHERLAGRPDPTEHLDRLPQSMASTCSLAAKASRVRCAKRSRWACAIPRQHAR